MTPTSAVLALQLIDDELRGVTGTLATERAGQIPATANYTTSRGTTLFRNM